MDVNTAFTWLIIFPMISSAIIYLIGRIYSRSVKKKNEPIRHNG